ncbi:hypothetical protein CROQUDRAFT_80184 [Cronartium quercuum f. sp. fusiforme G11]|uniref:Uncharacterized protein n=1 Tax=Cronartium quercuum f. sp. fusiforme G11 TaxID=708437 RepID=A0A9P6T9K2_9BASI|nr:hypothetical protein CROQUDRAFT_80184 [Cronartium quercuum f. sp. fusiforme G11]
MRFKSIAINTISITLLTINLPTTIARGILAIDYGTQFMQISLVQPGLSFDVLLNHDSKRKTQSVISIKSDDKLIGDDAASLAGRYPQNSFPAMKLLSGQTIESPLVKFHKELYNIPIESTERGTVKIVPKLINSNVTYLPEELIALQFQYAKELADIASSTNPNPSVVGGEKIIDCIITIPMFYNQFERKAILDAADLSGLKVLNLIDDGSSVGVNYAMMRSFGNSKNSELHLIYDVGASSIKSTIIEFYMFEELIHPTSKISKNVTKIDIKGYGFNRNFGGLNFDLKIRDKLKKDFEIQSGLNVDENDRAMIKLLREAGKVKHVLSANLESQSRIEGLVDEKDFKGMITRQEFEDMFKDETHQFTQPILDSLSNAQLNLADIKSVILVGGSTRVPMIQTAVKSLVGEDKVAVNVNADEAAVMGAALYGAGISKQFKTKDIRVQSIMPHTIATSYNVSEKNIKSNVYSLKSKLGSKKSMKIKSVEDFSLVFEYESQPDYFPKEMLNVTIYGISKAITNHTNSTGIVVPSKNSTVTLTVKLDESGILSILDANLLIPGSEIKTNGIADKIAGFFGSGNKKEGEDDDEKKESELDKAKTKLKSENNDIEDKNSKVSDDIVIKLQILKQSLGLKPMTTADKISSGKLIRDLKAAETRKKNREEARNELESYTYKLRDRLTNSILIEFSTNGEIQNLTSTRDEVSDWLNDFGEIATIKELKSKKIELETKEKKILDRAIEFEKRPEAYNSFETVLNDLKLLEKSITEQVNGEKNPLNYTIEDINQVNKLLTEQMDWFKDIKSKQDLIEKNQDVIIKVNEIESRRKFIELEIKKLKNRKPPKKKILPGYSTKPKSEEKAGEEKKEEKDQTEKVEEEKDQKEKAKDEEKAKEPVKDEL